MKMKLEDNNMLDIQKELERWGTNRFVFYRSYILLNKLYKYIIYY